MADVSHNEPQILNTKMIISLFIFL